MTPDRSEALVSADWLAAHLSDPSVRVIEIGYEPDIDEYSQEHIPGAISWFWKDCYWDELTRDFLTPAQMAQRFGAVGIDRNTTVVLYSGRGQMAAYGYWVFKQMCGHPDVRVLNGGRRAWAALSAPTTTVVPSFAPTVYDPAGLGATTRDDRSRVGRDEVLAALGREGVVLLDARYREEYIGDRVKPGAGLDHGAERHGHIPGAVSLPFHEFVQPGTFTFKSPEELADLMRSVGAAPDQAAEVFAYCRLGHRGSLVWFVASQLLGWDHVRVYDGSWTEWGSLVGVPIER